MRTATYALLFSFIVLGRISLSLGAAAPAGSSLIADADNQFALALYGQLSKEKPGKNLFFSPTSVAVVLSMAAAGANGSTETEMAQTLHLEGVLPKAHAEYRKLLERWNSRDKNRGYQLHVANRLWGQKGFSFLDSYMALTRENYNAEMGIVDFQGQTESACKEINQWVERQTADKIKDLIPAGMLDRSTRMVLTNAIYFKGDWINPFKKTRTQDEEFAVSPDKKIKAPMMHQKQHFSIAENDSLQVLELPYKGNELSMLVLLPKTVDGLGGLESSLTVDAIAGLRSKLRSQMVDTYLPKFKMETSFALTKTLNALGMKEAFTSAADFSGIDGKKDLQISAVVHKAFVDVNEEGTEAAAATGIGIRATAVMVEPKPVVFRADHPFVFAICDRRDGSILFLGR